MERRPVCKIADVPINEVRQFEADGRKLCIANAGDRVFACQATCPHEGIALCEGVFDGDILTCVEHLWQWSLREGGEPRGPADEALTMYSVEVSADTVYVTD